jgi:plastocyanin
VVTTSRTRRTRALLLAVLGLCLACDKNPAPEPSGNTPTVTITSAGVSPKTLQVALGQRVLFINNDTRSHNMGSDPHPEHGDCPEIDQVGFLAAGQRRETGNFVQARNCGYHDHDAFSITALQGTIQVR